MTAFFAGLLHPLVVPAHVLAIAALALLIGQQGWRCSVLNRRCGVNSVLNSCARTFATSRTFSIASSSSR